MVARLLAWVRSTATLACSTSRVADLKIVISRFGWFSCCGIKRSIRNGCFYRSERSVSFLGLLLMRDVDMVAVVTYLNSGGGIGDTLRAVSTYLLSPEVCR